MDLDHTVASGSELPKDKKEALAETYWLLAQSTPVRRGGSAYANVILEHLGHQLNKQGYEYEVPFTKDGVDLWAEAATTELDTFKERFVKGDYFDKTLTDKDVKQRLEQFKSGGVLLANPTETITQSSFQTLKAGIGRAAE